MSNLSETWYKCSSDNVPSESKVKKFKHCKKVLVSAKNLEIFNFLAYFPKFRFL